MIVQESNYGLHGDDFGDACHPARATFLPPPTRLDVPPRTSTVLVLRTPRPPGRLYHDFDPRLSFSTPTGVVRAPAPPPLAGPFGVRLRLTVRRPAGRVVAIDGGADRFVAGDRVEVRAVGPFPHNPCGHGAFASRMYSPPRDAVTIARALIAADGRFGLTWRPRSPGFYGLYPSYRSQRPDALSEHIWPPEIVEVQPIRRLLFGAPGLSVDRRPALAATMRFRLRRTGSSGRRTVTATLRVTAEVRRGARWQAVSRRTARRTIRLAAQQDDAAVRLRQPVPTAELVGVSKARRRLTLDGGYTVRDANRTIRGRGSETTTVNLSRGPSADTRSAPVVWSD